MWEREVERDKFRYVGVDIGESAGGAWIHERERQVGHGSCGECEGRDNIVETDRGDSFLDKNACDRTAWSRRKMYKMLYT